LKKKLFVQIKTLFLFKMDKNILNKATSDASNEPETPGWMFSEISSIYLFIF
jgi:hypothetical protein